MGRPVICRAHSTVSRRLTGRGAHPATIRASTHASPQWQAGGSTAVRSIHVHGAIRRAIRTTAWTFVPAAEHADGFTGSEFLDRASLYFSGEATLSQSAGGPPGRSVRNRVEPQVGLEHPLGCRAVSSRGG